MLLMRLLLTVTSCVGLLKRRLQLLILHPWFVPFPAHIQEALIHIRPLNNEHAHLPQVHWDTPPKVQLSLVAVP